MSSSCSTAFKLVGLDVLSRLVVLLAEDLHSLSAASANRARVNPVNFLDDQVNQTPLIAVEPGDAHRLSTIADRLNRITRTLLELVVALFPLLGGLVATRLSVTASISVPTSTATAATVTTVATVSTATTTTPAITTIAAISPSTASIVVSTRRALTRLLGELNRHGTTGKKLGVQV